MLRGEEREAARRSLRAIEGRIKAANSEVDALSQEHLQVSIQTSRIDKEVFPCRVIRCWTTETPHSLHWRDFLIPEISHPEISTSPSQDLDESQTQQHRMLRERIKVLI